MNLYTKSMRKGSIILFWAAIIIAAMTFVGVLGSQWDMVSSGVASPYEAHSQSAILVILTALASGLSSAAWPFFGAALLWFLDARFPYRGAGE